MDRKDELYKILRAGLTSEQTKEVAEYLSLYITDSQVKAVTNKVAALKKEVALRPIKSPDIAAVELAEKLYAYVIVEFPKYPKPQIDKWAKAFVTVRNKDKDFTYDVQLAVMRWIFEFDSRDANFWRGNIRSADSFKDKFVRLLELARNELSSSEIPTVG